MLPDNNLLFEHILQSSTEAISFFTVEGICLLASRVFIERAGGVDIVGKGIVAITANVTALDEFQRALQQALPSHAPVLFKCNDGPFMVGIEAENWMSVVRNHNGLPEGVMIVTRDVSSLVILAEVGQLAQQQIPECEVFGAVCTRISRLVSMTSTKVVKWDKGTNDIIVLAGQNLSEVGTYKVDDHTLSGLAMRKSEPVVVNNISDNATAPLHPGLAAYNIRSAISVPIFVGGEVWGALTGHSSSTHVFLEKEVRFMQSVASTLGSVVEHHIAEQELVKQNRYLEEILNHAPLGICYLNRQLVLEFYNECYARIMKIQPGAMVGRPLVDLVGQDVMDKVALERSKVLDGEVRTYETLLPFKEPIGPKHVRYTYIPSRDRTGEVIGYVAIQEDLTMRVQMENERQRLLASLESERSMLRSVLQSMNEGLVIFDGNGSVILLNDAFRELFHLSRDYKISHIRELRDHFSARSIDGRLLLADDLPSMRVFNGETFSGYELRVYPKGRDEAICALYNGFSLRDNEGNVLLGTLTVRDVTGMRHAQEVLAASEARFRTLYSAGIVGVCFCSNDGYLLEANEAFLTMLDRHSEELKDKGLHCSQVLAPGSEAAYSRLHTELELYGYCGAFEQVFVTSTGEFVPVLAGGTRLAVEPSVSVIYAVNISEVKRLERELVRSQKLESVGRLAGGIAHDFNNLLSVILGYTETLLTADYIDPQEVAPLQAINHAAERAADLVRQLLAFARRQAVDPAPCDVNSVITDLTVILVPLLGEKVDMKLDLSAQPCRTNVPAQQIEQLVTNLATNARDAMPGGGLLVIETSLQPEWDVPSFMQTVRPQSDKWVRISVRDTGVGMTDTVHTRVFEPFFTTKPLGKGTGLGLSICYGIAKQWDGEITIDSKPGEGTVVNVYLPMLENVVNEVHAHEQPTTEYAPNISRSQRILVVEDEDTVRRIVVQTLTRSGFEVHQASDGLEAMQLLSDPAEKFDLLLTDIVMPAMTGIELAERIAELRPNLVVIYMSGYAAEIVGDGTPLPESAVLLRKPFSLSSLLRTVNDQLANS